MDEIVSQKNSLKPHPGQLPLPENISQRELDAEHFLIQLETRMAEGDNLDGLTEDLVDDRVRELAQRIVANIETMYGIFNSRQRVTSDAR